MYNSRVITHHSTYIALASIWTQRLAILSILKYMILRPYAFLPKYVIHDGLAGAEIKTTAINLGNKRIVYIAGAAIAILNN